MRTTLTVDDTLISSLKKKAAERDVPLKTVVNQALRMGLDAMERPPAGDYTTPVRSLGPKRGYDLDTLGRTVEAMDDEERGGTKR